MSIRRPSGKKPTRIPRDVRAPDHKNVFVRIPVHGPSEETLDKEDTSDPLSAERALTAS